MSNRPPLIPRPALAVDGISVAKFGTALWALVAVAAWIFRSNLEAAGLHEIPHIATAGVVLGLIGLRHVTRRKRRLNL